MPEEDQSANQAAEDRGTRAASSFLTPEERTLRARLAAHVSWEKTSDPAARTEAARQAFHDSFEKQVDPDGCLDPAERSRRADSARKAHYSRLAYRSARARRQRGAK